MLTDLLLPHHVRRTIRELQRERISLKAELGLAGARPGGPAWQAADQLDAVIAQQIDRLRGR